MNLVLLATLAAEALAGPGLATCCAATQAGACPDVITAVGSSSSQAVGPASTQVTGLWTLRCDAGSSYDPSASQTATRPFPPGTVTTPMMPAAAACWDASCALPSGVCVRFDGTRVFLADCATGTSAPESMWSNAPRAPRGAVVISGRVLGGAPPAGVAGPPVVPQPGPRPVAPSGTGSVDSSLPPQPPDPCIPSATLRAPSNQQVDAGNEAIVAGDIGTALDRYRAAITINKCNAFAWAALGDALLQTSNAPPAKVALETAVRLMPTNFHAWTRLGEATEQMGDRMAAAEAYRQALQNRPGHAAAAQGLQRVQ